MSNYALRQKTVWSVNRRQTFGVPQMNRSQDTEKVETEKEVCSDSAVSEPTKSKLFSQKIFQI